MIGSFVEEPASLKEHGLRAIFRRASAVAIRPILAGHRVEIPVPKLTVKLLLSCQGEMAGRTDDEARVVLQSM
jgi:hypothetical protein